MKFGSVSIRGQENSKRPNRLWGPPVFCSMGARTSFPGVKRAGLEAHHTSSIVEVKNEWSYAMRPLFHMPSYCAEGLHINSYIRSGLF